MLPHIYLQIASARNNNLTCLQVRVGITKGYMRKGFILMITLEYIGYWENWEQQDVEQVLAFVLWVNPNRIIDEACFMGRYVLVAEEQKEEVPSSSAVFSKDFATWIWVHIIFVCRTHVLLILGSDERSCKWSYVKSRVLWWGSDSASGEVICSSSERFRSVTSQYNNIHQWQLLLSSVRILLLPADHTWYHNHGYHGLAE